MRLLALILALLATGCDGARQVNTGAAVPEDPSQAPQAE